MLTRSQDQIKQIPWLFFLVVFSAFSGNKITYPSEALAKEDLLTHF